MLLYLCPFSICFVCFRQFFLLFFYLFWSFVNLKKSYFYFYWLPSAAFVLGFWPILWLSLIFCCCKFSNVVKFWRKKEPLDSLLFAENIFCFTFAFRKYYFASSALFQKKNSLWWKTFVVILLFPSDLFVILVVFTVRLQMTPWSANYSPVTFSFSAALFLLFMLTLSFPLPTV